MERFILVTYVAGLKMRFFTNVDIDELESIFVDHDAPFNRSQALKLPVGGKKKFGFDLTKKYGLPYHVTGMVFRTLDSV